MKNEADKLAEALPKLPQPHAVVNGKLGYFCSFDSTKTRRGDPVFTAEQMHAYGQACWAAAKAQPVQAQRPERQSYDA